MFVRLNRSPVENGRVIGRSCGGVLRRRIRETRRLQKQHRIADAVMAARIRDFTRLVRRVDRTWLDEAGGLAQGARVALDDILMLNCPPPDLREPPGHSCTSFICVSRRENLLFKIRDERNRVQAFFISAARGRRRLQAAHDVGNMGVAHFLNASALGGANDTGSHTARVPDAVRLNDCHLLRYFGERAATAADVPKHFERLLDLRAAGGAGAGRGAIFLFADPEQGLILETVSDAYAARFVTRGTHVVSNHFLSAKARRWMSQPANKNTLLRKTRMEQRLLRCATPPTPEEVFALSRDRRNAPHSLCNDNGAHFWMTVSAQLHVINRQTPEQSVNYMCCGNTRHSLYVPVPLAARETYLPFLNGAYYKAADRAYRAHACSAHFQKAQKTFEKAMRDRTDYATLYKRAFSIIRAQD